MADGGKSGPDRRRLGAHNEVVNGLFGFALAGPAFVSLNHVLAGLRSLLAVEARPGQGYLDVEAGTRLGLAFESAQFQRVIGFVPFLQQLTVKAQTLDRRFLVLVLGSDMARYQIEAEATGSSDSMQNIGQDTIRELVSAWPSLQEQRAIVVYLDRETARMDGIAQAIRAQIGTVREYRQALISAAVTGKIDVRGEAGADGGLQGYKPND